MKFNYYLSAIDVKICIIKKFNSKIQTDDKVCNIQEKRQIQSFNIYFITINVTMHQYFIHQWKFCLPRGVHACFQVDASVHVALAMSNSAHRYFTTVLTAHVMLQFP